MHSSSINITDIFDSSYDPVRVTERLLTNKDWPSQNNICIQSDDSSGSICGGTLLCTTQITNNPFFITVELEKNDQRPVQPKLSSKLQINIGNSRYDLAAVIYHHNAHFWCEMFVSNKMYKEGWYVFNDLWNNGITEYVGKHPQTKRPETMHILIFEKCQARTTTSTSKDTTSLKQILTKALQMKQTNDTKQVKDNYVRILKSCSISVDLSISSKEMKEKILANEQIILSALSKKANEHANIDSKRKSEDSNVNYASPPKKTCNDMSFHK